MISQSKKARRFRIPFCGVYLCPMRLDRRPFFVACIIDSDIAIFSGSHVFEFDIFKGYLPKDFLERLLLLLLLCTFIPLLEVLVVPPPPLEMKICFPLSSWPCIRTFQYGVQYWFFARKIANFEVSPSSSNSYFYNNMVC